MHLQLFGDVVRPAQLASGAVANVDIVDVARLVVGGDLPVGAGFSLVKLRATLRPPQQEVHFALYTALSQGGHIDHPA